MWPPTIVQRAETQAHYAEQQQAEQMVTVTGPMADYLLRQKSADIESLQPIWHKTSASDHVVTSPVGTSTPLFHKTFKLASIVDVPFELPAHASSAQLRGTYRAFLRSGGTRGVVESSDDPAADVEFLLLNERQYADLLTGRPGDVTFSIDDTSNEEVNFTMPPTFDQPAKYYLVFRNGSDGARNRVVQADFRIDF